MGLFSSKKDIDQEALWAYRNRLPEKLEVTVRPSEDGGYFAEVDNLPGVVTEGDDVRSLYIMVNDAVYTYLQVPQQYIPFLPSYLPPKGLAEKLGEDGSFAKHATEKLVFARS